MRAVHLRRALGVAVVVAASTPVLNGCNLGTPLVPLGSPTPTATVSEPVESDVLFTVAVATVDGIELQLVGHAPQEWDAPGREAITADYIEQCSALGGGTVSAFDGTLDEASLDAYGSSMMVIDVTSTPAGSTLAEPIELQLGNPFYFVVATGDGLENPNPVDCYGGYQLLSTGNVSAIVNYETGSPDADLSQWRTGRYGFIAAFDSTVEFSTCTIALTALAREAHVEDVDGWDTIEGSPTECAIGYQGE